MESVIKPEIEGLLNSSSISLQGYSLMILGPENCFRRTVQRIVLHSYFDSFIIFVISLSSVMMAIDSPLNDPNGSLATIMNEIDYAITGVFVLEGLLKIILYGFACNGR